VDLAIQYSTSANLAARIALHQRFSTNPYGLQRWIFDRLQLAPGLRVLEIACGAGNLWRENLDRLPVPFAPVLSDFSLAMVQATRSVIPRARFVQCALPVLPFADASFDLVIANHMLYHVAERERGIAELRRVLHGDGFLFAATNGIEHLHELKELMRRFAIDAHDVSASFTLENGEAQLRSAFDRIEHDEYADTLRITDPAALLGYIASVSERAAEITQRRAAEMRAVVEERIAHDGAFLVRKSTGAFLARG
jgi:SAM-dependent methyltransferase